MGSSIGGGICAACSRLSDMFVQIHQEVRGLRQSPSGMIRATAAAKSVLVPTRSSH